MLTILHAIESDFGRERRQRWGQRVLDMDLIAAGDFVMPNEKSQAEWRNLPLEKQKELAPDELILPHPRLQDRAFVLVPLAQIAPDWLHPLTDLTVVEMRDRLEPQLLAQMKPLETPA